MSNIAYDRLERLRKYMKESGLQAFVVPSTDAHCSEYTPSRWKSREWLTGFTGSAGTAVVTLDKAGLWTDSRYFLQAAEELEGSGFALYKERQRDSIKISDFLRWELDAGARVGIDGAVFAAKDAMRLEEELKEDSILLVADYDPFEALWEGRPGLPCGAVEAFPPELAGEGFESKKARVLAEAEKMGADAVWVSSLDAIAWLFNIRGSDVEYNPVALAHAFVSKGETVLFVGDAEYREPLFERDPLLCKPYSEAMSFLGKICNYSVAVDSAKVSYNIYKALKARNYVVDRTSVVDLLKSRKNEVEIQGFRNAMVRDGVAMTQFWMWLEKTISHGFISHGFTWSEAVTTRSEAVTTDIECDVIDKLDELRGRQPYYRQPSFRTIAAYGAHAALNHYEAKRGDCFVPRNDGFLLVDSGGQYMDGTTDITRTYAVGALTEQMRRDYTLVLKGMIALSQAVFPAGARGSQIDILARKAMWEQGVNYGHGTGHGVGHYLNVHEGPQSIRQEENPVGLESGIVTSNEPGIYRDGEYGVRIENMLLIYRKMTTAFGDFLAFETLTLCPIDTTPIVREMMTADETAWLNNYHTTVYERLAPHLNDEEKEWLKNKTAAI